MIYHNFISIQYTIPTVLLLTAISSNGFSLEIDQESRIPQSQIQQRIDRYVQESGVPGIIIGVDAQGERWFGASGIANRETNEPFHPDTQFRLASITKTITAALIVKLAELGKLSFDDTLEKWLPGLINQGEKITIAMLLNHTSGLHDHENIDEFNEIMIDESTRSWTNEEILALINQYPLDFEPGSKQSYCNSGYYLLGMIAETAAQDTVDRLTRHYLFNPAGIQRTNLTREGALSTPYAPGYCRFDDREGLVNIGDWNLSWDWTAGSGVSTASDLLSWIRSLFSGQIVSPASLQKMITPDRGHNFGFGVGTVAASSSRYKEAYHTHGGYNPGTHTVWIYFPESDTIVTMGINYSEYRESWVSAFTDATNQMLLDIYAMLVVSPPPSDVSAPWEIYR